MMTPRLVIDGKTQRAHLYTNDGSETVFTISTAANGFGCEIGSYKTPTGYFKIAEKIGDGCDIGTIFKSRQPTGNYWRGEDSQEDLILTRILWLSGIEPHNANTEERYIYLHGTNHENTLGSPCSHGCIRFSNQDIITLYNALDCGDIVLIKKDLDKPPAPKR